MDITEFYRRVIGGDHNTYKASLNYVANVLQTTPSKVEKLVNLILYSGVDQYSFQNQLTKKQKKLIKDFSDTDNSSDSLSTEL